jgi:hypothetical protein
MIAVQVFVVVVVLVLVLVELERWSGRAKRSVLLLDCHHPLQTDLTIRRLYEGKLSRTRRKTSSGRCSQHEDGPPVVVASGVSVSELVELMARAEHAEVMLSHRSSKFRELGTLGTTRVVSKSGRSSAVAREGAAVSGCRR